MNNNDELNWVFDTYGKIITKELGDTKNTTYAVSFFSGAGSLLDEYTPYYPEQGNIQYKNTTLNYNVTIYNDYEFNYNEKNLVSDIGIGTLKVEGKDLKIFRIITPFTRERSYDFIITKQCEFESIIKELQKRKKQKSFTYEPIPIFGVDVEEIRKETIDVLLNEDRKAFCKEHFIPLKRGIMLLGKPGNGKTMTLQYLKNECLKEGINFSQYTSPKNFLESLGDFEDTKPSIYCFEDFDGWIKEREETLSSNGVLTSLLQVMDGVNQSQNSVFIFTSNMELKSFDKAFVRPGRIDKVIYYDLPRPEIYKSFFKAYIKEEASLFDFICESLKDKVNAEISYSLLKGICDGINILKFYRQQENISDVIEEKDIEPIIDDVLDKSAKGKAKSSMGFVL